VGKRFEAYGWQVLHVAHGNTDLAAIDAAISEAKADTKRPSLLVIKTTIGFGSPNKAGKSAAHGSPLGDAEIALTKKALGWASEEKFFVPADALTKFRAAVDAGKAAEGDWEKRRAAWAQAFPELAAELERTSKGELPKDLFAGLPEFKAGTGVETRTAAGQVLNALALKAPEIIGGDADLGGSTKTVLKDAGSFEGQGGTGRNIHFGVREHAMAGIANGIAYHGGLRPFTATFFAFTDYMRPSVRLAAMNHLPVVHVWTHDSIGLGEDGPTHQPVEHLMAMRTIPNLHVVRPADATESTEAWRYALERKKGPTGLVLTRQKVPTLDRSKLGAASGVHQGAYVLSEAKGGTPKVILIATGSEVQLALGAQEQLEKDGTPTRVVSMPCMEAFRAQPKSVRDQVLPPSVTARVSIEAGITHGWQEWVGEKGATVGVDTFGASAPDKVLFEQYGLTVAHVVKAAKSVS
jgi:transketolase